jgi:hypothetical protein
MSGARLVGRLPAQYQSPQARGITELDQPRIQHQLCQGGRHRTDHLFAHQIPGPVIEILANSTITRAVAANPHSEALILGHRTVNDTAARRPDNESGWDLTTVPAKPITLTRGFLQ